MKSSLRARWEACARREAEWFYGTLGGKVPETGSGAVQKEAVVVFRALESILTFHRGALSLFHAKKVWPKEVRAEFGQATSLVVRLECALHPAVGLSTEVLEAASVERLSALIARGSKVDARALRTLKVRAGQHYRLAIRALAKARRRCTVVSASSSVPEVVAASFHAKECA